MSLLRTKGSLPMPEPSATGPLPSSYTSDPLSSVDGTTVWATNISAQLNPPYQWDATPNPQPSYTPDPLTSSTAQPMPPDVCGVPVGGPDGLAPTP